MKLQLHGHASHEAGHDDHHRHKPLSSLISRAERSSDYLIIGLIVVLGLAMAIGLFTAAGADY